MTVHQLFPPQRRRVYSVMALGTALSLAAAVFFGFPLELLLGFALLSLLALASLLYTMYLPYLYLTLLGWGPQFSGLGGLTTLRPDELVLPIAALGQIFLLALIRTRCSVTVPKTLVYTWGAYLALTLLAMLVHSMTLAVGSTSLIYLARLGYLTLVFYTIFVFIAGKPHRADRVMGLLVLVSLGIAVLGILQWFNIGSVRELILAYYPRVTTFVPAVATSTFGGNPTILGTFLLIAISYVFSQSLVTGISRRQRAILYGCLGALVFCLFLTVAKAAILILPIVLLAVSGRIKQSLLAMLLLAAVIYLTAIFAPHSFARFSAAWEGSVEGRVVTWVAMREEILADVPTFVFGHGFTDRPGQVTESQYIWELYHKGVLGLVGYVVFVGGNLLYFLKLFRRARHGSQEQAIYGGTVGMLIALVLVGVVYTTIHPERLTEWVFVMLGVAYAVAANKATAHRGWTPAAELSGRPTHVRMVGPGGQEKR